MKRIHNVINTENRLRARTSLLDKLRKILFSTKVFAPLISIAIIGGACAFAQEVPFVPTDDISIENGQTLTVNGNEVDLKSPTNDKTKTITLNGGTFNHVGTDVIAVGDPSEMASGNSSKKWEWGANGGTINIVGGENHDYLLIKKSHTNSDFSKTGDGSMYIEASAGNTANEFNNLTVSGGIIHFYPETEKKEDGSYKYKSVSTIIHGITKTENSGSVTFYGDTTFKGKVYATGTLNEFGGVSNSLIITPGFYGGEVTNPKGMATFEDAITIDASLFAVLGGATFTNAPITIQNGGSMIVIDYKDENGQYKTETNYDSDSTITLGHGSVYGVAHALGTDIIINPIQSDENEKKSNIGFTNSFSGMSASVYNPMLITKDEYDNITELVINKTREAIGDSISKGEIVKNKIKSGETGTTDNQYLTITSHYSDEQLQKRTNETPFNGGNFYTVIFEDRNNEGLFTEYTGNVGVDIGTMVLSGSTTFGSGTNAMKVWGSTITKDQDSYVVNKSGTFAFYRGDVAATEAPTLNVSSLTFGKGADENQRGACLWFDTTYTNPANNERDNLTDRKIGTINAGTVVFERVMNGDVPTKQSAHIWYDGISNLPNETSAIVDFNVLGVRLDDTNNTVPADTENISELFGKPLVDASVVENGLSNFTVTINAKNVQSFAASTGMTAKEQTYAGQMDQKRLKQSSDTGFYDAIYNENDPTKVRQTIHNLARATVNSPQISGHMGNPTSVFFGGFGGGVSGMSGAMSRGQSMEETPQDKVAIDNMTQSVFANNNAGNNQSSLMESAWVSFSHTSVDGDEYLDEGILYDSYKVRRTGLLGGLRRQFNDTTSGGILFSYSSPEVRQAGNYQGWDAGYRSGMDMEDFQFALHLEKTLLENWEAALYVGGGTQSMDWNRSVIDTNNAYDVKNYVYTADSTGNTFTATAYLSRRVKMTDHWTLRPTVGIDSEHSWLFNFTEQGNTDTSAVRAVLGETARAYHYDTIQYSRNTARVGLSSVYNLGDRGAWTGRVFYGVQLGGEDAPDVALTAVDANGTWSNTPDWICNSNAMGSESLNLGTGGFLYLNHTKTLTANADYNALMYKNAVTQNVTAGIQWRY